MKSCPSKIVPLILVLGLLLVLLASTAGSGSVASAAKGADVAVEGYVEYTGKGTTITYEIEVVNDGPALAKGVTMKQTLSPLTNFVGVKSTAGECTGGPVVKCLIGRMEPGMTVTMDVVVSRITIPCSDDCNPAISSRVKVTSRNFDPDATNNSYVVTTY